MTDKHTPTPWNVSTWVEQPNNRTKPMVAAKGVTIAITHPAPICQESECEANARHIVKCVNYHDRLVEALRDMVNSYDLVELAECEPPAMTEAMGNAEALLAQLDTKKESE